jgi:hypothetical protein
MKEHLVIVLLPLIFANCLHMLVVKHNLFPFLQVPLSGRLFGENKTLRGFLLLPLLNGAILSALAVFFDFLLFRNTFLTGALLGFSYLLGELPNSFLKRRMGIISGGTAVRNRYLFTLFDKTDSALGVVITYWLISGISSLQALLLFLCCSLTHFGFSWLLVRVKLKKSF